MADADVIAQACTNVDLANEAYELALELRCLFEALLKLDDTADSGGVITPLAFAFERMAARACSAADVAHTSALRLCTALGGGEGVRNG